MPCKSAMASSSNPLNTRKPAQIDVICPGRKLSDFSDPMKAKSFLSATVIGLTRVELPCRDRTWGAAQEHGAPPARLALKSALREKAASFFSRSSRRTLLRSQEGLQFSSSDGPVYFPKLGTPQALFRARNLASPRSPSAGPKAA
jgi:hypothetical protein